MKREDIFRDTKNWYASLSGYASGLLIDFAAQHAGSEILDIGCATGEYIQKLSDCGFKCVGVDINPKYVESARSKGLEVYRADANRLYFEDKSFDTALLFEVLEHTDDPMGILKEAKRVSRKNVLITVPNSTGFDKLGSMGLTYEHMLERDHINFFTKSDLNELLSGQFEEYMVEEKEPIYLSIHELPEFLRPLMRRLYNWKLIHPTIYYRLYAVAKVD